MSIPVGRILEQTCDVCGHDGCWVHTGVIQSENLDIGEPCWGWCPVGCLGGRKERVEE